MAPRKPTIPVVTETRSRPRPHRRGCGKLAARDRLPGPATPELTGPVYAGHVFWDAEVFVLAVLAAVHPAAARAMVEYRIVADVLWAARRYADWTGGHRPLRRPRTRAVAGHRYWA